MAAQDIAPTIDLSAGLVPKESPVDLSAGLVSKDQPAQAAPISDPTPEQYGQMSPAERQAFDTNVRAQRVQNLRDVGTGIAQGAGQTVNRVSKALNKIPLVGEYLAPKSGINAAEQMTTTKNTAQEVGSGVEGLAEFVLGDEAVKGLSLAERAGLLQKVAKVAESHPAIRLFGGWLRLLDIEFLKSLAGCSIFSNGRQF